MATGRTVATFGLAVLAAVGVFLLGTVVGGGLGSGDATEFADAGSRIGPKCRG